MASKPMSIAELSPGLRLLSKSLTHRSKQLSTLGVKAEWR